MIYRPHFARVWNFHVYEDSPSLHLLNQVSPVNPYHVHFILHPARRNFEGQEFLP